MALTFEIIGRKGRIATLSGIFCILYSCSFFTDKGEEKTIVQAKGISARTENLPALIPPSNGIIRLNLTEGKGKTKIQKKKNQIIYIEFESKGYKNISANLYSNDSMANIRFSQIELPNKHSDGPFGRRLDYNISSNGIYTISVHEDMMAGNPWSGVFDVDISLTK